MAGQVRAAVDAAVGAVRRRQIRLERLDGSARRRGGAPCRVSVSHECRLPVCREQHPPAAHMCRSAAAPPRPRTPTRHPLLAQYSGERVILEVAEKSP